MTFSRRTPIWIWLVALGVGVIGGTLTHAVVSLAQSSGHDFSSVYLAITNAFLLTSLLIVSLIYADNRRLRLRHNARIEEKVSRVFQQLDRIFHTRTGLTTFLLKNETDETQIAECVKRASDFLKFLTDETRTMFDGYTNHPCSVAIKLLVPAADGKSPVIKTFLRDTASALVRNSFYAPDGLYPYSEHSPFLDIVSGKVENEFYLANDLRSEAAAGRYRNGNPYWRKFYNATLIVPVKEPSTVAAENILGFLCIDSRTAKFDQAVCVYIARIIANTIFYVIYTLSVLESKNPSQQSDLLKRLPDAS